MSRTFDKDVNDLTKQLGATKIPLNGVDFSGRALRLDNAQDAKPVIDAINSLEGPLEYLKLEGNTIGVEAAEAIAKALECKSDLRQALWKDMFTSRSKTEIPPALKALSKALITAGARLEVLDLSDNASGPIGVDGISDLLTSEVCWGLKELRLANMGLGTAGAQKLAKALQKCYDSSKAAGSPLALKVFVAGRNRLENPGCIALSQVFKQIGTLEQIQIYQNGIYHPGIKALSDALVNNPNLRILDLNDNTVTHEGAVHLSRAFKKLPNLTTLNLGDCLLRSEGAKMIAAAIKESLPRLENLVLSSNEISGKVGLLIAEALARKKTLQSAYLGENGFGSLLDQIEDTIQEAHSSNPEFVLNIDDNEDDEEEEGAEDGEDDHEEETSEGEELNDENEEEYDLDEENEGDGDSESYSGEEYVTMLDTTSPMRRSYPKTSETVPFLALDLSSPGGCYELINHRLQGKPDDEQIEELLASIMYVSSKINEKTEAVDVGVNLYKKLFTIASGSSLSLVNNLLPGYVGLMKFEKKKELSKYFNSTLSQTVLKKAMDQGFFPKATVDTLTFLLDRETNNN